MKNLLLIMLLCFGGYKLYEKNAKDTGEPTAFDKQGRPLVELLAGPPERCLSHCDQLREFLARRNVSYSETMVVDGDGVALDNKRAKQVGQYPALLVGERLVTGADLPAALSALAENFGTSVLTPSERAVMQSHFDNARHAKVVMYGTAWCPYCAKVRGYLNAKRIPYEEFDVEKSEFGQTAFQVLKGSGYPLIYVGFRRVDSDEKRLQAAIDEANGRVVAFQ